MKKILINKSKILDLIKSTSKRTNVNLENFDLTPYIVKKGGVILEYKINYDDDGNIIRYDWYYNGIYLDPVRDTSSSEETLVSDEEISKAGKKANFKLYVGGTGTGKTYRAIKEASKLGRFLIAVPTRQLAYEIYIDYSEVQGVASGEINKYTTTGNNVVVYEELLSAQLDGYNTLIVDEAHFLQDEDRGAQLLRFILNAIDKGVKDVILLTATDSLSEELKDQLNIQVEELKPRKKVKKIKLKELDEIRALAEQGKSVLVFTKYKPTRENVKYYAGEFGIDLDKCGLIHAGIPTSERIKTQIAFKEGKLKLVLSSNVLAQGVNFPADVVVIEYNERDSPEIIQQKIGRAGRPQFSDKAYWYARYVPEIHKRRKNKNKKYKRKIFYKGNFILDMGFESFEIPGPIYSYTEIKFQYEEFKYSKRFLSALKNKGWADEEDLVMLDYLLKEEKKLESILDSKKKI